MKDYCVEITTHFSRFRLWEYSDDVTALRKKMERWCQTYLVGRASIEIIPREEILCH